MNIRPLALLACLALAPGARSVALSHPALATAPRSTAPVLRAGPQQLFFTCQGGMIHARVSGLDWGRRLTGDRALLQFRAPQRQNAQLVLVRRASPGQASIAELGVYDTQLLLQGLQSALGSGAGELTLAVSGLSARPQYLKFGLRGAQLPEPCRLVL